jgi:NAD(P)-dependent dehydrogenase (short-subunit alcohol dehydrogenase family)
MLLADKVVIVTGGGNGIGAALCRRFAAEGAKAVVVADIDAAAAQRVASEVRGLGVRTDVTRQSDLQLLVDEVISRHGAIDLFCSNAGIAIDGGTETPDADWQRCWDVNVMAHVFAARAVLPGMSYGDRGIGVSALCPQGVRTEMLRRAASGGRTFLLDSALEPEQVADDVVKGLAAERFLILPHPDVAEYFRRKATDYDRWLRGMRKLRQQNL